MNHLRLAALVLMTTPLAVHSGSPAPPAPALQAETATLKPSALPGYAVAQQHCMTCHSVDYIQFQPPGLGLAQWTAEAAKMQHLYGAPISDGDVALVGAYLAVAYGNASEETLPAALKSPAAAPAPVAGAAVDVNALLAKSACLGCHAVEQKVVGPAYREVAAKYRGDGAALEKVAASIRQGGSGKWGAVPMPPFPQLSEAESKALASYVLAQ